MRNLLILAALLLASTTAAVLPTGRVTLQSNTDKYMTACTNCISYYPGDLIVANETNQLSPKASWILTYFGDKVGLLGYNGKYLSRLGGGWGSGSPGDTLFAYRPTLDSNLSLFTPVDLGNNKWAFKQTMENFCSLTQHQQRILIMSYPLVLIALKQPPCGLSFRHSQLLDISP